MSAGRIVLTPRGEFSLAASIGFLTGFTPLAYGGVPGQDQPDVLRLAFPLDGDWHTVGLHARQGTDGQVTATVAGAPADAARGQVARLLSLDIDAGPLAGAVAADDVAGALVRRFAGLRPVLFASPYEAAAWCVLGQRIRMVQAAALRTRICERLGTAVQVDGSLLHAFPDPATLRRATVIEGVPEAKLRRLHGIADAALSGDLDAAALRAAGPERALAALQQIPGIGPFSAELILVRGAGEPDHFPRTERRLHTAMARAYGVDAGDIGALAAIAARWAPFRSWISFLFRTDMNTHQIGDGS